MFYLFFFNSSTMGLSTTLFVMAFLLFGKHLWLCKVLESCHCLLMSLTTANPGLKLGGFYSLSIQCYTLPNFFFKKRKKKTFVEKKDTS